MATPTNTVAGEYTASVADSPLQGMLGIEQFITNARPESFRQGVLRYQPNGTAPIYALTNLMPSEQVQGGDPKYHWFTKGLNSQRAAVDRVTTTQSLAVGNKVAASGTAAGTVLYVKLGESTAALCNAAVKAFRPGHQVILRYSESALADVNAKVLATSGEAGTNSYIQVKLLEADDNSASYSLADCDTILVVGNINADGGLRPQAISYTEEEFYNYCQTFRNSVNMTRRRMKLKNIRSINPYDEAKKDAMQDHMMEIEKAFIWGEMSYSTGSNGQPETTTRGIIPFVRANAPANVVDYTDLTAGTDVRARFQGKSWAEGGFQFLMWMMEQASRYTGGGYSRMAFCGTKALMAIQETVLGNSELSIRTGQLEFGIKVTQLISVFGVWNFIIHPLFSHEASNQKSILIVPPGNLRYKYIDDTDFKSQSNKTYGENGKDGLDEEYLTDCGLEIHHPHTFMFLTGIGNDNTQA